MNESNFKKNDKEIQGLLAWSVEDLKIAKLNLKNDFYRGAISRAYFSAFDLVRALLLSKKVLAKSHKGVIIQFNQHFIETKILPQKWGKWFASIQKQRLTADYDTEEEVSLSAAKEIIGEVDEFHDEVYGLME